MPNNKEKDIIHELADDFFSVAPRYRTKKRLYGLLEEAYEQGHVTGVILGDRFDKVFKKKSKTKK